MFFSFDFRYVPRGPPKALFGPPGDPKIDSKLELSLPLVSESLPERFRDAPGTLRDPFWGAKREVPTLTKPCKKLCREHILGFSALDAEKARKIAKFHFKINRFFGQTGPGGPPKVLFFRTTFFNVFLDLIFHYFWVPGGAVKFFGNPFFPHFFRVRSPTCPREAPGTSQGPPGDPPGPTFRSILGRFFQSILACTLSLTLSFVVRFSQ